jgi:hypothetical protein
MAVVADTTNCAGAGGHDQSPAVSSAELLRQNLATGRRREPFRTPPIPPTPTFMMCRRSSCDYRRKQPAQE